MTSRMPAEWGSHERLWIGFPGDPAEWPNRLTDAQRQAAAFADAVHAQGVGEFVTLVTRTKADWDFATTLVSGDVTVIQEHFGDIWLRDTGPIGIIDAKGNRALAAFDFNGWGGKFEMAGDKDIALRLTQPTGLPVRSQPFILEGGAIDTDGSGLFVTTEQCLLNPNRNPTLDRRQIETLLSGSLGLADMVWLGDGLAGDHTDGHVDNLARFVAPGVLAVPEATTRDDPNAATFADAAARAGAYGLEVVRLPSVGLYSIAGEIAPASYMNFVISNACVIVPQYGAPNDKAACEALAALFPQHAIVGLPSDALLLGGGSFHCMSQQLPAPQ